MRSVRRPCLSFAGLEGQPEVTRVECGQEITDGPITDTVRSITLNPDLTVDLGNGEEGIWNFKEGKNAYLEMEVDLDFDERSYLLYRVGRHSCLTTLALLAPPQH